MVAMVNKMKTPTSSSSSSSSQPTSSNTADGAGGSMIHSSLPRRILILVLSVSFFNYIMFLQIKPLFEQPNKSITFHQIVYEDASASSLRQRSSRTSDNNNEEQQQCRFYLAESAVGPDSGLGIFTATGLLPGDMVGFPNICIFLGEAPKNRTQLRSHTFGQNKFFGQHEGSNSRAACEGFATTFNTMPDGMYNTKLVSPPLSTNAGLDRATSPGAGAITHHFGIHASAMDVIEAGSELTIYYGDFFLTDKKYTKPQRPVSWLRENGWCIDNIRVGQSSIPDAGRGAFAHRAMLKGQVVAPAPLQSFKDRKVFQNTDPEQLYVNYCFQPANSHMIFYPYGAGVNLINHSREKANVYLQWSTSKFHHREWLEMSYDECWNATTPGGIILEVVAARDIQRGEELFLDYGRDWEEAWKKHVKHWQPPADADSYVYPAEMDETQPLRTLKEQETNPYAANLATICQKPSDWDRGDDDRRIDWYETPDRNWWRGLRYCHILRRQVGENGDYWYTVAYSFTRNPDEIAYDKSIPLQKQYVNDKVPRRAIRFVERPYMDDEHLPGVFRHPIELPEHLVPDAWKNDKEIP